MADQTTFGYPYPEATDPIADYPVVALDLAATIQQLVGAAASGLVTVTPDGPNVNTIVTVTFPIGRFTAPPVVVASTATGTPVAVGIGAGGGTTATATTVSVQRPTVVDTVVRWIAHLSA